MYKADLVEYIANYYQAPKYKFNKYIYYKYLKYCFNIIYFYSII